MRGKKNSSAPSAFHFDGWFSNIYTADDNVRNQEVDALISSAKADKEAARLMASFEDKKEFIKTTFIPFLYYVPLTSAPSPGKIMHMKFSKPAIGKKHKKLPLIFGTSYNIPKSSKVDMDYVSYFQDDTPDGNKLRQILSYAKALSGMTVTEKHDLYESLLDGIESYRAENQPGEKGWLSDYLRSEQDYKPLGFVLNMSYTNVDPSFGSTSPFWVHPWGIPMILFVHKRLPFFMEVGPSMRLDENVVGEKNMVGYTS